MAAATGQWWKSELAGCTFADPRLGQRLRKLIERMGGAMGASPPLACQDWASTKAAYRCFSNDRVGEDQILAGHFHSTRERFAAAPGTILVLQDTTEFTYQRERSEAVTPPSGSAVARARDTGTTTSKSAPTDFSHRMSHQFAASSEVRRMVIPKRF